ncbi:tripartite tricarboxylate transporter substrate binding protein [Pigmentiphaga soli]|uniref:Tripartite tricarboxylate transporter substrate binding protein n=1 Tax=Pigmentiphaga soli TaxID=1007095 RepID=A0ABP8HN19_9BURK
MRIPQTRMGRPHRLALLACCAALIASGGAAAQDYPNRSIRMVVAGAAGGASDTIARILAEKLPPLLGKPVVVENRPGAGTTLASELVANAPPDGYTIQFITNSHTINGALRKHLRYNPIGDFAAVTLLATQPNLIMVGKDVPAKTLTELVALARKEPGKLNFGSAGAGSASALAGELFKSVTGADLMHVPYQGGTPALVDALAGRVQVLFFPMIDMVQYVQNGRLRGLAITSQHRSPLVPDIPTNAEAGVPGIEAGAWYGIAVPGKTPAPVIARLNRAFVDVLKDPAIQEKLAATGSELIGSTPEYFARYMIDDIAHWERLVKEKPELAID